MVWSAAVIETDNHNPGSRVYPATWCKNEKEGHFSKVSSKGRAQWKACLLNCFFYQFSFFKAHHYFFKCLENFQVDATLMVFWLQDKVLNGKQNPLILFAFSQFKTLTVYVNCPRTASSQRSRFGSSSGFSVELYCSSYVGFLLVFLSTDWKQKMVWLDSELPPAVSVWGSGVCPVTCRIYYCLSPVDCWDSLQHPLWPWLGKMYGCDVPVRQQILY